MRPKNPPIRAAELRRLRKSRGWSVRQLARHAEAAGKGATFSPSSVQAWELGYHAPDRPRLEALAWALGVPVETLEARPPPLQTR